MENATKALLVAAVALITIVLISIGVLLIKNVSGIKKQTEQVSETLGSETGEAATDAIGVLGRTTITKEEFNDFAEKIGSQDFYTEDFLNAIRDNDNRFKNQIEFEGYVFYGDRNEWYSIVSGINYLDRFKRGAKVIESIIPEQVKNGKLFPINEPYEKKSIGRKMREVYNIAEGEKVRGFLTVYMTVDKYGYIDRTAYIAIKTS